MRPDGQPEVRRSRNRALAALAMALLALGGVLFLPPTTAAQPAQVAQANPTLRQIPLQAGIHRIKAEVAATPEERSRGLMLRTGLGTNQGMLFIFEAESVHCFWMKNTLIPLSIAFLSGDGTVVTLADMAPHDEQSHCPARPVRYALEMQQGWFKAKGLRAGDRITGLE